MNNCCALGAARHRGTAGLREVNVSHVSHGLVFFALLFSLFSLLPSCTFPVYKEGRREGFFLKVKTSGTPPGGVLWNRIFLNYCTSGQS